MLTFKKLKEAYSNKGINLFYMRGGRKYGLSIINAPIVAQGVTNEIASCQLTGYYTVYLKEQLQDVESMVNTVFDSYREQYSNNEVMLAYIK